MINHQIPIEYTKNYKYFDISLHVSIMCQEALKLYVKNCIES